MSNAIFSALSCTLLLFTLSTNRGLSQEVSRSPLRLMFYNVENLFDTYDDTLKEDNDFLPGGVMGWNLTRYEKKISSLYKTIIAAGKWSPPDVVAFCEIENRKVLNDLVYGTYLSKFNFGIIHEESPDQRGIDVCLIYRKELIKVIDYKYWIPDDVDGELFTSRSVLYSCLLINGDTLHLIVNHWPSKRGGVLASEDTRIKIAAMVSAKADSIISLYGSETKVIITGDFNCTPQDNVIGILLKQPGSARKFINLSESICADGKGTYRFMGIWEMIDQMIVSKGLLSGARGLYTHSDRFAVLNSDFLLVRDPKYPGFTPFSTYRGYRYQGGYSDHLPILLDLEFR